MQKVNEIKKLYTDVYGETCGIYCNDGWYNMLINFSNEARQIIKKWKIEQDKIKDPSAECGICYSDRSVHGTIETDHIFELLLPRIDEIKEKFAAIRIYTGGYSLEELNRLIDKYEMISHNICEICGDYGEIRSIDNHWFINRCENCLTEVEKFKINLHKKAYPSRKPTV